MLLVAFILRHDDDDDVYIMQREQQRTVANGLCNGQGELRIRTVSSTGIFFIAVRIDWNQGEYAGTYQH